jgi:microcompartment protein CcmL/EutN
LEALAAIEGSSLPVGLKALDACIKKASLEKTSLQLVSPGKFVLLIGGSVGAVEESYVEGRAVAEKFLLSHQIVMDVHPALVEALHAIMTPDGTFSVLGKGAEESVGVFEWSDICQALSAVDQVLKRVNVSLPFLRIAKGIGGKTLALFQGELGEIEAARDYVHQRGESFADGQIIARPDPLWLKDVKLWLGTSR